MCVALLANARSECKKRCQESLKIIENEAWKDLKIIKKGDRGAIRECLGQQSVLKLNKGTILEKRVPFRRHLAN